MQKARHMVGLLVYSAVQAVGLELLCELQTVNAGTVVEVG